MSVLDVDSLCKFIRVKRAQHELSQETMATELGISVARWSSIERTSIPEAMLVGVCRLLQLKNNEYRQLLRLNVLQKKVIKINIEGVDVATKLLVAQFVASLRTLTPEQIFEIRKIVGE